MELRRPLTAAAASSVLIALMFVPSASASVEVPAQEAAASQSTEAAGSASAPSADSGLNLADTGSIDTTPYLLGGTAFLGVGTGLVLFARRRALEEA